MRHRNNFVTMTHDAQQAARCCFLTLSLTHVRQVGYGSLMTRQTAPEGQPAHVPELTLGWRLKMALGNHSAGAMARELGVTRATVSRWMGDKGAPPKKAYVQQWALITGVAARLFGPFPKRSISAPILWERVP